MRNHKWSTLSALLWMTLAIRGILGIESPALESPPAERRILNAPLARRRPWATNFQQEYDEREAQEDAPRRVVSSGPYRLRPYSYAYFRRPDPGWPNYQPPSRIRGPGPPSEPTFVSFNGDFQIDRDRFVSFGVGDAMMGHPDGIKQVEPPGTFQPPEQAIPFVSAGQIQGERIHLALPSTTTFDPIRINVDETLYYTPPVTTTTDQVADKDRTLEVEKYAVNVTERVVAEGDVPTGESLDGGELLKDATWVEAPRGVGPSEGQWTRSQAPTESGYRVLHRLVSTDTPLQTEFYPASDLAMATPYFTIGEMGHTPSYSQPDLGPRSLMPPTRATTPDGSTTTISRADIRGSTGRDVISTEPPPLAASQTRGLSTGAIAGIAIGILAPMALVAGAVAYLLYGRRFNNVIHKVESRSNGERGHYIDDSIRPSGYMNSHIELPKESSEEMTSLDNDSFLNSLEAVTIQNYWAESAKNTKV